MELVLVFAVALLFYGATLAPTVIWGDSAWLSLDAVRGSFQLKTAMDHPLFLVVGHVFSAFPGEAARNINFEAAVFGALTVTLVYRFSRRLGTSKLAAAVGAAALCVSHAFWLHSVIAEVYTANAFFLAGTLNLLLEWRLRQRWGWLAASAAVFAIGLTNHLVLATSAPGAIIFVVASKGRSLLTRWSVACLVVVASVLLIIAVVRPAPVQAEFRSLWYGPPGISEYLGLDFAPGATAREAGYYLLFLIYQFPSVSLLLGATGIWVLWHRTPAIASLLLLTMGLNAAAFIRHTVWLSAGSAKYVFYIADYVVFSIACAVGADEVLRRMADRAASSARRRLFGLVMLLTVALVPPTLYTAAPMVARRFHANWVGARSLPYRDNDQFFLNPSKRRENGARRFGEEALRIAGPGAVIFADHTPYAVLRYLRSVDRLRPDVMLCSAQGVDQTVPVRWIFNGGHRRPTYLAAVTPGYYDLSMLTGEYDLVPVGPMIEVRPRGLP